MHGLLYLVPDGSGGICHGFAHCRTGTDIKPMTSDALVKEWRILP